MMGPRRFFCSAPLLKTVSFIFRFDPDPYFVGPRDLDHHSRLPLFLRLHGSIAPKLLLPLLFVGSWATAITCISTFVHNLGTNTVLLTVLGFVVSLTLGFRSTTAYERYNDGRKYWAQLTWISHNFARLIWEHAEERHNLPEEGKKDLLLKINCLNLIVAFAVALKHKLRFEPYMHYEDLKPLVKHLDTFARAGDEPEYFKRPPVLKKLALHLGVTLAESNPRKAVKKAKAPLGNLPLEILTFLSAYLKQLYVNDTFKVSSFQTQTTNAMNNLNDVLTGTDRILNTPLPLAYSIAISQITWAYILALPFQIYNVLGWVTIPGTVFAAYVIFGIALIGREIENPFGSDVNDLPLDVFCDVIRKDLDTIMAKSAPVVDDFVFSEQNEILYPISTLSAKQWRDKSVAEIKEALAQRAQLRLPRRKNWHRAEETKPVVTDFHGEMASKEAGKVV